MGKIKNTGQISGAVANLVFVNRNTKTYVRSKPDSIKQSKATKTAAGIFGQISQLDSRYRKELMALLRLHPDNQYAFRHRSCFSRMAVRYKENRKEKVSLLKGDPKSMEGFDFNQQMPWVSACRFFPEFHLLPEGKLQVSIPELELGTHIKTGKPVSKAVLQLFCIAANPDIPAGIRLLSDIRMELNPKTEASEWLIPDIPEQQLIFVIGQLKLYEWKHQAYKLTDTSAVYLWGKKK